MIKETIVIRDMNYIYIMNESKKSKLNELKMLK